MSSLFIIDIDGTIANNEHRRHVLCKVCRVCASQEPQSSTQCPYCESTDLDIPLSAWKDFGSPHLVAMDSPIPQAIRSIKKLKLLGIPFIFLTGRDSSLRKVTEEWIYEHIGAVPSEKIKMRENAYKGMAASDYKELVFLEIQKGLPPNTTFIFADDDPYVLNMYSKYGITLKCPEAWDTMFPAGLSRRLEPAWNL